MTAVLVRIPQLRKVYAAFIAKPLMPRFVRISHLLVYVISALVSEDEQNKQFVIVGFLQAFFQKANKC
jgi:hypothetical protein